MKFILSTVLLGCNNQELAVKADQVINDRLMAFKKRKAGFRTLKAAGGSPARIIATGGSAGMTCGQPLGTTPSQLEPQRGAVAKCLQVDRRVMWAGH